MEKQSSTWIVWIIVILVVLGLGYWIYTASRPTGALSTLQNQTASLESFDVEKPNFVAHGTGLSKVEIWAVPKGSDVPESSYVLIGNAALQSTDPNGDQVWTLTIPESPIFASDIFAKGFDKDGLLMGKMSLPYSGVTEIYNNVWGPVSEKQAVLSLGQSVTFDSLTVTLDKITQDSRCPAGVQCITAGRVVVELDAKTAVKRATVSVDSSQSPYLFDGYFIEITGVDPAKTQGTTISQNQYKVHLSLSHNSKE